MGSLKNAMVLILSEQDVAGVLQMADGVRLVERAFRDHANGQSLLIPRVSQDLPNGGGAFRIMPAVLPSRNWFGLKTLTGFPGRRLPGETYFAVLLFEMETGALRAVVAGSHLTGVRTGAASGVAAKYLARDNAEVLGVFGAGVQARHQVAALVEVRPVKMVKVFDRNKPKAAAFVDMIRKDHGIDACVSPGGKETVIGSDLLVTATTSREPLFSGDWLEPGTHLSGMGSNAPGKRELDKTCFSRSKVVVDFKEQALEESGDLRHAIESGAITPDKIHAELGEIVTDRKVGRQNDDEITLFKSVGVAIEDIATAAFAYEKAIATGVGTYLQLDSIGADVLVGR